MMYEHFEGAAGSVGAGRTGRAPGSPDFGHIGILNDYVRVPYAAGSTFAAQLLHDQFRQRGHEVTLIGPRDPSSSPEDLPERTVLFPGIPIRCQPGFFLPLPSRRGLRALAEERFDVLVGQTGSSLMDAGIWLRQTQRVPLLCVNTTLLSAVYDAMLPDRLSASPRFQRVCRETLVPIGEQASVTAYNQSDGLVVLSRGLERYWRNLGVEVPIHVIPRSINPRVVSAPVGPDPFDPRARRGSRLIVLCRHVREKGLARLLDIFAQHVAPRVPEATLTLVGDGADQDAFKARAERLGIAERCFWPGEFAITDVRTWYAYGDVFVYASMSETYGQVVSEAMYCGLPVVAFDDAAGVEQQIDHEKDGLLLAPGPDAAAADHRFGAEVVRLLEEPGRRRHFAERARSSARERVDPDRVIARYYAAFETARRHRETTVVPDTAVGRFAPIARWAAMHSLVGAMGNLRPASVLNRHGRKQPAWNRSPTEPALADGSRAA